MKKSLFFISIIAILSFTANAQTCATTGGCAATATNSTGQYPTTTFSTTSSSWTTVSAYMNAGNFTLFNVTNGNTYEWTYCSDFGGSMGWDAELTLFNNASGVKLCYANNCGRTNCVNAPYIRWTATYTGTVKLLTTVSGCTTNTGTPYSTLVWRDTSGTANVTILGLDVSSYQGTINWTQVKAAGYVFAWAKASEGVGLTDSKYVSNATNGVSAGVKMGAYHFSRPENNTGVAEANYFVSVAGAYITSCELPPVLDLEDPPSGPALTTYFTSAQLTTWVQDWMTTVKNATGINPILYTNGSIASYLNSSLTTYKLWIADPDNSSSAPPTNIGVWPTWAFKQYSWTTNVPGITTGGVDADVFNGGSMAALNNLMGCSTTGIANANMDNNYSVYPNPTTNSFNIDYTGIHGQAVVNVYDLNGRIVLSQTMDGKTVIDASSLNAGIYNINIVNSEGVANKRLIIVK
jgi:GH25 family lysozyme M1 (1,4-beta-N-acetylmuramidase)